MLDQTVKPEEMLIIKDGPLSRQLEDVIENFSSANPGLFTVVSLDRNQGLGVALNKGVEACRNELIARMDADDISLPQRCEKQLQKFKSHPELVILGTYIDEFYNDPTVRITSRVVPIEHTAIVRFSRLRSPFNHPTVMFRRSFVLRCGNYSGRRRQQDHELFVRMLRSGCKAANLPESLLLFRSNIDATKRKQSYSTCKSYIGLIYGFWRQGHSRFFDLALVVVYQILLFLSPHAIAMFISNGILRKKIRSY